MKGTNYGFVLRRSLRTRLQLLKALSLVNLIATVYFEIINHVTEENINPFCAYTLLKA